MKKTIHKIFKEDEILMKFWRKNIRITFFRMSILFLLTVMTNYESGLTFAFYHFWSLFNIFQQRTRNIQIINKMMIMK